MNKSIKKYLLAALLALLFSVSYTACNSSKIEKPPQSSAAAGENNIITEDEANNQTNNEQKDELVVPDFSLTDLNGNTVKLSDYKGKVVILNFWASWCPDCRKASPTLVELHERFKDKNLTIVGVSIDEERSRWLNAIEKDGLAWQQVISEGGWNSNELKAYAVRWLPTSYLIDPEGVIVAKSIEVSRLIPQIEALLN